MRNPEENSPRPEEVFSGNSASAAASAPAPASGSIPERFASLYEELRRIAGRLKQGDGSPTLTPTALVHEAYLRLALSDPAGFASEEHFWNTVVAAMRHLLVDAARRRIAQRHGGGARLLSVEALGEASAPAVLDAPEQILDIQMALERVENDEPVLARVFEYHFFAGLTQAEIARHLGMSDKVARNRLRLAKARIVTELARGPGVAAERP